VSDVILISAQMPIVRSAAVAALLDALAALKFGAAAALLWLCGRGAAARSLLGAWTVCKTAATHLLLTAINTATLPLTAINTATSVCIC
jgi:hypothetical protein